VADWGVVHLAA